MIEAEGYQGAPAPRQWSRTSGWRHGARRRLQSSRMRRGRAEQLERGAASSTQSPPPWRWAQQTDDSAVSLKAYRCRRLRRDRRTLGCWPPGWLASLSLGGYASYAAPMNAAYGSLQRAADAERTSQTKPPRAEARYGSCLWLTLDKGIGAHGPAWMARSITITTSSRGSARSQP